MNRHREPEQFDELWSSDPLADFLWADPTDDQEEAVFNYQRQTSCQFG